MNIFTQALLAAGLAAIGTQASAQTLYDNFENTRLVTYPVISGQGALAQNAANPGSTPLNSSATCGMYTRSGSQYDVLVIKPTAGTGKMADVAAYAAGTKKMSIKFRSPAAGVLVQAVLQNKAGADLNQYPKGKFGGDFNATTTKTNDWETLTFTYAAGTAGNFDPGTTSTDVDQVTLLIAPNTTTAGTVYYLDDIMGPELLASTGGSTPAVVTDQLYDNNEGTRVLKYKRNLTGGGFKLDTLNPHVNAGNTSAHVTRYSRSSQRYDGIFLAPVGAPLADVTPFLSNAKQMTLKVYSPAVGTHFQVTLQDSTKARGDYPAGRHSEYLATTTTANAWETLVFTFSNRPDGSLPSTGLNELVLLINSNTVLPGKFYFDDFTGPHLTNYTPTAARLAQTSAAALAPAYPNPAGGLTHLPYSLQKAATVSLAVYDALGRRVRAVLDNQPRPAGDYSADLNTAALAPGLYIYRLTVDGTTLSRSLSVE